MSARFDCGRRKCETAHRTASGAARCALDNLRRKKIWQLDDDGRRCGWAFADEIAAEADAERELSRPPSGRPPITAERMLDRFESETERPSSDPLSGLMVPRLRLVVVVGHELLGEHQLAMLDVHPLGDGGCATEWSLHSRDAGHHVAQMLATLGGILDSEGLEVPF